MDPTSIVEKPRRARGTKRETQDEDEGERKKQKQHYEIKGDVNLI